MMYQKTGQKTAQKVATTALALLLVVAMSVAAFANTTEAFWISHSAYGATGVSLDWFIGLESPPLDEWEYYPYFFIEKGNALLIDTEWDLRAQVDFAVSLMITSGGALEVHSVLQHYVWDDSIGGHVFAVGGPNVRYEFDTSGEFSLLLSGFYDDIIGGYGEFTNRLGVWTFIVEADDEGDGNNGGNGNGNNSNGDGNNGGDGNNNGGNENNGGGNGGGNIQNPPPIIVPPQVSHSYSTSSTPIPSSNVARQAPEIVNIAGNDINVRMHGGRASVQFPANSISNIVEAGDNVIHFNFSGLNITSVSIPRSAFRQFANAGMGVEIILPQGAIALDSNAVTLLSEQAHGANITFRITELAGEQMPPSIAMALPTGAVVHRTTISVGSRAFRNFEDAVVSISLPAISPATSVWSIDTGGRLIEIEADIQSGSATFETNTLGLFVVGQ